MVAYFKTPLRALFTHEAYQKGVIRQIQENTPGGAYFLAGALYKFFIYKAWS